MAPAESRCGGGGDEPRPDRGRVPSGPGRCASADEFERLAAPALPERGSRSPGAESERASPAELRSGSRPPPGVVGEAPGRFRLSMSNRRYWSESTSETTSSAARGRPSVRGPPGPPGLDERRPGVSVAHDDRRAEQLLKVRAHRRRVVGEERRDVGGGEARGGEAAGGHAASGGAQRGEREELRRVQNAESCCRVCAKFSTAARLGARADA